MFVIIYYYILTSLVRLSITKYSVQNIKRREKEGSLTIKVLREAARALDIQLVYGFVPNV